MRRCRCAATRTEACAEIVIGPCMNIRPSLAGEDVMTRQRRLRDVSGWVEYRRALCAHCSHLAVFPLTCSASGWAYEPPHLPEGEHEDARCNHHGGHSARAAEPLVEDHCADERADDDARFA
jgi:hypothetical protein